MYPWMPEFPIFPRGRKGGTARPEKTTAKAEDAQRAQRQDMERFRRNGVKAVGYPNWPELITYGLLGWVFLPIFLCASAGFIRRGNPSGTVPGAVLGVLPMVFSMAGCRTAFTNIESHEAIAFRPWLLLFRCRFDLPDNRFPGNDLTNGTAPEWGWETLGKHLLCGKYSGHSSDPSECLS